MSIRVVTDSTCDLPAEIADEFHITIVPCVILFGDEEVQDRVEITSEQFFKRLARESEVPTTTQPSAGAFRETYEQLIKDGATSILSLHLSGKLSGTLQSARQAADGLSVPVEIVDSQQVSLALGMGVVEAARAVQNGASLEQAKAVAEDVFRRSHLLLTLETLEYLRRGGRMSRGQEIVGSLLKVKPIITVENGEVAAVGRIRTKQKAIEHILDQLAQMRPYSHTFAVHATTPDELDYVATRLQGLAGTEASQVTARVTPVLGVHTGPGMIGCGVVRAPDEHSPNTIPR